MLSSAPEIKVYHEGSEQKVLSNYCTLKAALFQKITAHTHHSMTCHMINHNLTAITTKLSSRHLYKYIMIILNLTTLSY